MLTWPESCRKIFLPPDYDIIRWVESRRVLDRRQASETGPKKISRTPALETIYKWFLDESIREIVIQKPAQIGVTDAIVDILLWIAENDPSPTALYLADQDTARKIMKFRIDPAFRAIGLVKRRAKNTQQDVNKFEINFKNGFYLMISWGSSVSQAASMSFKYVITDEINKPGYEAVKDEGETLGRIGERMETFGDSKFIKLSTPTLDSGKITQELNSCDVVYDYQIPCQSCGEFQIVSFSQVVWEGGSKASRKQMEETARYKCVSCGYLMSEKEREEAVSKGKALPRLNAENPEKIGYQLHRLVSLFKGSNLGRMAYGFARAQDDQLKLQNVINSWFGEPWIPRLSADQDTMQDSVSRCKNGLAKLVLPQDALCIIVTVDVQMKGFWYVARAICRDSSRHSVDAGFVATWEELDEIVFERKIEKLSPWRCLIDTGGGQEEGAFISRVEETYQWIRSNQHRNGVQIWGCKGSSRVLPTKIRIGSPIEKTPSGKPIPGGIRIVSINTDACKDAIWFRIDRTNENPELPGNWWINRDTPEWYMEQMTAEAKEFDRKTQRPEWRKKRADNHIFDCEVLQEAAIDPEFFGGIRPMLVRKQREMITRNDNTEKNQNKPEQNPVLRRY